MSDNELIQEVVAFYFKGTYHGSEDLLRKAFHPAAHITGNFKGQIVDWTLDDFIARVTTTPTAAQNKEPYEKEITLIDQTENAAMVKAKVVVGGIIFTDYITLLKMNERWVIRNKSFTT